MSLKSYGNDAQFGVVSKGTLTNNFTEFPFSADLDGYEAAGLKIDFEFIRAGGVKPQLVLETSDTGLAGSWTGTQGIPPLLVPPSGHPINSTGTILGENGPLHIPLD